MCNWDNCVSLLLWPLYRFPPCLAPWQPSPCHWSDSALIGHSQEGSIGRRRTLNASDCSNPFSHHMQGEKLLWSQGEEKNKDEPIGKKERRKQDEQEVTRSGETINTMWHGEADSPCRCKATPLAALYAFSSNHTSCVCVSVQKLCSLYILHSMEV